MIAYSELGDNLSVSDDGYNVLVGSTQNKPKLFDSYADHPQQKVWLPRLRVYSTAAGRYQLIRTTWGWVRKAIDLPDFRPENQDRAAILLIKWRKALELIEEGKTEQAIYTCNVEWASLPGDRYGQGANPLEGLLSVYRSCGGKVNG